MMLLSLLRLSPRQQAALHVVALALSLSGFVALWPHLWHRLSYEAGNPLTWDSTIYLAVGRGILNGLTPYRDLFETKPPGIFLLSALVLRSPFPLTGALTLLALTVPALALGLAAALLLRPTPAAARAAWTVQTLVFGSLLTLYCALRSGEFQVEAFGAACISLYAVALAIMPRGTAWRTVVLSGLILGGIGMKEPFLLVAVAAALIVDADDPRQLLWDCLVPCVIAVAAGSAILLILGYLVPYITIYLPATMAYVGGSDTLVSRLPKLSSVWIDATGLSPLLPALILICACATAALAPSGRQALMRLASLLTACALLGLAICLGRYFYSHHFVFAVPGYTALMVLLLTDASRIRTSRQAYALFGIACITVATVAQIRSQEYSALATNVERSLQDARNVAASIDGVMDHCGYQRYLFLGANGHHPYAFTRHSPLGPLFFQYDTLLTGHHSLFRKTLMDNVEQTPLVVLHAHTAGPMDGVIIPYLEAHFSAVPPECAGPLSTHQGAYTLLFRHP